MSEKQDSRSRRYWRANLLLMTKLSVVWFVVSFGCGVLWVEELNQLRLGGYKLGFWFAQQGAIYVFIALIFYYAKAAAELDRQFDREEDR